MADNKTRTTGSDVDEHLAGIDPKMQADAAELRAMCEQVAGAPSKMWGPSIIGAGHYHYKYESGREGDMAEIGFAVRSGKLVVYVMGQLPDQQTYLDRIGKYKMGKACLYIKRLDDIDREVLRELMAASVAALRDKYGEK
ncbi:MAG: DUF1801 domain-containing protein [Hyphomicrobiaceae bacterium]|nr:DUF1801 domain-containing protein [Hyphomicrobiaceae bacterium]MCC0023574.1 DUF1801 domain-containing protein [Hyphomicrobiaceae bacterium]